MSGIEREEQEHIRHEKIWHDELEKSHMCRTHAMALYDEFIIDIRAKADISLQKMREAQETLRIAQKILREAHASIAIKNAKLAVKKCWEIWSQLGDEYTEIIQCKKPSLEEWTSYMMLSSICIDTMTKTRRLFIDRISLVRACDEA